MVACPVAPPEEDGTGVLLHIVTISYRICAENPAYWAGFSANKVIEFSSLSRAGRVQGL